VEIDALAAQRFEILKDALDSGNSVVGTRYVYGIGAEVDADAELVFHQPEVFIASPEQGLKVWRDLQSDLQRNRGPPVWRWMVELNG